MKKFIKPEINSVELSTMESIMVSINMVEANKELQSVTDLNIKKDFAEWQGFKNN